MARVYQNIADRLFTRASEIFTPAWCQDEAHWTVSLVNYFWADCACCLFFRGIVIGACLGLPVGVIVGAIL